MNEDLKQTFGFSTKDEMLDKLRSYAETPDDDNIRIKEKIKHELLSCPELLYALNNKELEHELFDSEGNLIQDGEWDRYFGYNSNIRPFLFFPEVQTDAKSYLCYQVQHGDSPRYNPIEKYCNIVFTAFVYQSEMMDFETGIPRHDLIISIIRERFAWTNILGSQCEIISNKETTMDNNYIVRTLIYRVILPNSIVNTKDGKTGYINKKSMR